VFDSAVDAVVVEGLGEVVGDGAFCGGAGGFGRRSVTGHAACSRLLGVVGLLSEMSDMGFSKSVREQGFI
jgi:hypothetical protein